MNINPFQPTISMYILHTIPLTLSNVQTRKICFTIKSFLSRWSFPLFLWHYQVIKSDIEIGSWSILGVKQSIKFNLIKTILWARDFYYMIVEESEV